MGDSLARRKTLNRPRVWLEGDGHGSAAHRYGREDAPEERGARVWRVLSSHNGALRTWRRRATNGASRQMGRSFAAGGKRARKEGARVR